MLAQCHDAPALDLRQQSTLTLSGGEQLQSACKEVPSNEMQQGEFTASGVVHAPLCATKAYIAYRQASFTEDILYTHCSRVGPVFLCTLSSVLGHPVRLLVSTPLLLYWQLVSQMAP